MSGDGAESSNPARSEAQKIADLSEVLHKKFLHIDKDLEKGFVGDLVESLVSLAKKIGVERLTEYKTVLVEGASVYPFAWFLWSLASRVQTAKGVLRLPAFAPYGTGRRERVSDDTLRRIAEDIHRAKYPEPILIASDIVDSGKTMKRFIEALEKEFGRKLKTDIAALSAGSIVGKLDKEAIARRKWLEEHAGNLFTEDNTLLAELIFASMSHRTGFRKEVGDIRPKAAGRFDNTVVTAWTDAMEYVAAAVANDMLKKK